MRKRVLTVAAMAALLALVPGCDDDNDDMMTPDETGPFDLAFTGTIAPHAGQMLRVLVIRQSDDAIVGNETQTVAGDGTFSMTFTGDLEEGESYRIDFYADHNGDGTYDTPPTDHAWRETIDDVSGDAAIDFQHNTNFTDVGTSFVFDLTFDATVTPHSGQDFYFSIWNVDTSTNILIDQTIVPNDGMLTMSWPGLLEDGRNYRVDFYADHNDNGMCDPPVDDHAWRRFTNEVRGNTTIDFPHDTDFTDVCDSF